ncbi:protein of unknown function DUF699 ATPase putative [Ferroglobus placidus DSM 10642]|uniref:tRNA(Met) cytidine acetyltransferase TmcA n=1 Tax=Ferroglobus placidus (strain DSM 10642 / AEDII12DO) TaxID=589924 RepID=D3RYP0_FERPA|nr:tRNA(Met) cytidine acetyltransferase TmcA [Ferroglobus placidus]ADC65603.1 protein of unknown function DUF699 ATPase putative [Ferroglobus placidus DSM 10642]
MTFTALMEEVEKAHEISKANRHRFAVFLCADELEERILKQAKKIVRKVNAENVLAVGRSKFVEMAKKHFKGKIIHYKDTPSVLGETYDALIIDMMDGFHPNDLGIVVETIREGGVIVALSPKIEKWFHLVGKWHEELVSEPYTVDDVVPRFYRRFIKKTLEADGIIIFDSDKRKILKKFTYKKHEATREEIVIPSEEREIKRKLYKLCATQDQVRVLEAFETFFDRKREKKAVVITANRGRGKTAVLGIVTPYLISRMNRVLKRPVRILVVAPTPYAVQTYFKFLKKALVRQGMKEFKEKRSNDLVTVINSKWARVEYAVPRRAMVEKDYADIIIVDEAAGIDVPVLWKIVEGAKYMVFSTTIHGYEGTGRGFAIRFLRRLEKDESVEIVKIHMEEPIRYGKGDPIEAWLYEVLMLDAQPAKIEEEDVEKIKRGELEFEEIDKDELIKNDSLLREFFGIYVLAHYRNRPSDLVILLDMPNHLPLRVKVNNKTVCSLHIAIEGKMDEATIEKIAKGYKPKGQIIPDLILKHYWNYEFPKLTGIRIVRIATHPDVMDMGIGSFALKKAVEWAESKGMDWAGSGFGVSPELLRFWMRNGFTPVHITPQRNEVSGEHSAIVLKALNDKVYEMLEEINSEFIRRLIELLGDELKDLEVETTKLLLSSILKPAKIPKPEFGRVERRRIKKYLQGQSLYEYTSDIIKPMVRYYYSQMEKIDLDEDEEKLLIAKCLQLKSWSEIDVEKSYKKMVKAVQKLWRWFYEGGEED